VRTAGKDSLLLCRKLPRENQGRFSLDATQDTVEEKTWQTP